MLCNACQDIFTTPRKLSHGTYYGWTQDHYSFQAALRDGCHLCHLVEEIYGTFPGQVRYAFKALRSEWARFGTGPKWFPIPSQGECGTLFSSTEKERYLRKYDRDPTPNGLGSHLEADSDTLEEEMLKSWLVLEFYGPNVHFMLPIDLAIRDEAEELAQENIKEQTSTGCEGSLSLGRKWLNNCLTNHSCAPPRPEVWLPTRLLDVGSQTNPVIRLVRGSMLDQNSRFLALSHRWGADGHKVLKSTNIHRFEQTISKDDVSATLLDSIAVTRALGFQYLWADTICIIQDDPDDWSREAATMCKVYGLATCTIAGANSGHGTSGFFADRIPYRVRPCRVPNPFRTDSKYSFYIRSRYLQSIHDRDVRDSAWYNRGWVFQERTLSHRLLIFSRTQMIWGCGQLQAAEMWPGGKTSENHIDRFPSLEIEKGRFRKLLNPSLSLRRNCIWLEYIQDYISSAKLTFQSDKLVAIQGIATLVQDVTGEGYCGGLWLSDDLPDALMWIPSNEIPSAPKECPWPSWSWAALTGAKAPDFQHPRHTEKHIQILSHCLLPVTSHGVREPPRQALHVAGKLLPAVVVITRKILTQSTRFDWGILMIGVSCGATFVSGVFLLILGIITGTSPCIILGSLLSVGVVGVVGVAILLWRTRSKNDQIEDPLDRNILSFFEKLIFMNGLCQNHTSSDSLSETGPCNPPVGRLLMDRINIDEDIPTGFDCFLDYQVSTPGELGAFCLPVISRKGHPASGLILRLADPSLDHYQRIGVFEISGSRLLRLSHSFEVENFWLV